MAPHSIIVAPKILQTKTFLFNQEGGDTARYDGQAFSVGLSSGVGAAFVGYELEGVSRVELEVGAHGNLQPLVESPENSFAGFIIDYHTAAGYSHRVAIALGLSSTKRTSRGPEWGKFTVPDQFVEVPISDAKNLDLAKWAPQGWDHRAWLSAIIQNSGANTILDGRIIKLLGD